MKEYYTIGEFSKLFNIDKQTLRYYDKIGLISPTKRNDMTGWRYYVFDQVYQLASIRFMRRLGFSIEEVKVFFGYSDISRSLDSLKEHSSFMKHEWEKLIEMDNVIQRKLLFVENKLATLDVSSISVKWFPERSFIPIGQEESLYNVDVFYCYPTVVFYEGDSKRFGAYVDASFNGIEIGDKEEIEMSTIPSGKYLCCFHVGPYSTIKDTFDAVNKARPECKFKKEGYHINFNIIDQFIEKDSSKFITEIQIPLM